MERRDFLTALGAITPASHRSAAAPARPLPSSVNPLLQGHLDTVLGLLQRTYPPAAACLAGDVGPG